MIRLLRRGGVQRILAATALVGLCAVTIGCGLITSDRYRLATFSADVTPPLGHPLVIGNIKPATTIVDPLTARGFVLLGTDQPLVFVTIDWCEIRNDAYDRWRTVLAQAAGTQPERVLVAAVHQHDAPIFDLTAQKMLDHVGLKNVLCDVEFHERMVQRVAQSLRDSLPAARPITHLGIGKAEVQQVASNRRVVGPDGRPHWSRTSATPDAALRDAPVGTIDPYLRTLSFWDEDKPVLALHCYATHPMSYYGQGGVSADFVGIARAWRQNDDPRVFQIYASGCSGDVVAGKYNDGSPENRPLLAQRIYRAMFEAWKVTRRYPLSDVRFSTTRLQLHPRDTGDFTQEALQKRLADPAAIPHQRVLAALGLSWRARVERNQPIDLPAIDFGVAQLVLMPGETFVEYQLAAQKMRPSSFVVAVGYGECAAGYIPTQAAVSDGFMDGEIWSWVAPDAPDALTAALRWAMNDAGR